MIEIKLTGIEKLKRLTPSIISGARRGVLASAQRYVELVHDYIESGKSFSPKSGYLQESIGWMPDGDRAVVYAQAEYAKYIEFGTSGPYVIMPKRRKALRFPVEGGYVFSKKVKHPGIKKKPFMFAEISTRKRELLEVFRKKIEDSLNELDNRE